VETSKFILKRFTKYSLNTGERIAVRNGRATGSRGLQEWHAAALKECVEQARGVLVGNARGSYDFGNLCDGGEKLKVVFIDNRT